MRIPFTTKTKNDLLNNFQKHTEKTKECAWVFQQAMECVLTEGCEDFGEFRQKAIQIEIDAANLKQQMYRHSPKTIRHSIYKTILMQGVREQHDIIITTIRTLTWISLNNRPSLPKKLEKDFFLLIDVVIEPIEELHKITGDVKQIFAKNSKKQRKYIYKNIQGVHEKALEAHKIGNQFKKRLFALIPDPIVAFQMILLAEMIDDIAGHGKKVADIIDELISAR